MDFADPSAADHLAKRQQCYYSYGRRYCYSDWYYWGRWVLAGIALVVFFLVLLSCCLVARRRRRRGTRPFYGTGWMAPPPKYGAHQNDYQLNTGNFGQGGQQYGSPPAYGQNPYQYQQHPQNTGTTFNANDGYYGNQQYPDAHVQSPPHTYQPDGHVYPPPPDTRGAK